MAKRKSSSKKVLTLEQQAQAVELDEIARKAKAANNPWHKHKFTKAELKESALFCQLPFIKDTRREIYHADAGLCWWHVTNPQYWHQGIEVGKAFADRVAVIVPQDPKKIEEVLCHSLEAMLREGGSHGIAIGFLHQLAHYAVKGMRQGTPASN